MESKIKLGKEYNFAGYRWVPVKFIDEEKQIVVMQSLGVTVGPWPGYSMLQFGNGYYCSQNISSKDISDYDNKTRALMEQIRPIVSGDAGLYLPSYDNIKTNSVWRNALAKAAANYRSFGASYDCAWTGTYYGSYGAWIVDSYGGTTYGNQYGSYVVPAAFDLNLSKIEIEGDEIVIKNEYCLPYVVAYNIKWDTDGDPVLDQLPEEIKIPVEVLGDPDEDAISDYLFDQTGFCHDGYQLGLKFRGDIIPYEISWRDNDNILYFQTDPIIMKPSKDSSYVLSFEANVSKRSFSAEVGLDNMVIFVDGLVSSGSKSSDVYLTSKEMSTMKEICFAMVDSIEAAVEQNEIEDSDSDEETVKPQYLDVKVPGGILRARACIDPDYPGMDIEFIPDEEGSNVNAVSLPRVLIEKPVENGKLRAIVWGDELKEDPTLKIEFL